MGRPEMPSNIEVGKVFAIEKGKRKAYYKIIPHPYFDDAYALIADHAYLRGNLLTFDKMHICSGSKTIEGAWQQAYDHT